MARATKRKAKATTRGGGKQRRDRGPPTHAFSVDEFCDAHRLSKAQYYELRKQGLTPTEMAVGRRRIISHEAAEQWRRQREQATV
jgi:hypothetical protein